MSRGNFTLKILEIMTYEKKRRRNIFKIERDEA